MISYLSFPDVKTLIIADDDPDDQVLLRESMEGLSAIPAIKTVFDGTQLMNELRNGALPDLILLDLNMPNKNGLECLREIKAGHYKKKLPVVVLSTSQEARDMEQCYDQGAHLFVSKPNSFQHLKIVLRMLLHIDWKNFPENMCRQEFLEIGRQGLTLRFSAEAVVHS